MNIGLYFTTLEEGLENYLSPFDLLDSLSKKDITICVPNWLGYEKNLSSYSNIEYLSPIQFYSLDSFFVFLEDNSIFSNWMKTKHVCFVIQGIYIRFSEIASTLQQIEANLNKNMPRNKTSFISHYYKNLQEPFKSLFDKPKTKYRNCYITNDCLVYQVKDYDFDPSKDFIIAYTTAALQKSTCEDQKNALVSPSSGSLSFKQALLAENIFFEPDMYDVHVLHKALKEVIFSNTSISTHNPELKKILELAQK